MKKICIASICLLLAWLILSPGDDEKHAKHTASLIGRLDVVKIIAVKCTIEKGWTTDLLVKAQGEADIGVDLTKAKIQIKDNTVYLQIPEPDGYFPKLNESNTQIISTHRIAGNALRMPEQEVSAKQPEQKNPEEGKLKKLWEWTKTKAHDAKIAAKQVSATQIQKNERELFDKAKERIQGEMRELAERNSNMAKQPIQNVLTAFYKNAGYKDVVISWQPALKK